VYVYIYVCVYVYVYVDICTCIYNYVFVYSAAYICVSVYTYAYSLSHTHTQTYTEMCVYVLNRRTKWNVHRLHCSCVWESEHVCLCACVRVRLLRNIYFCRSTSMLRRVAECCQCTAGIIGLLLKHYSLTLQHAATYCNTLQHTATTLQAVLGCG